MVECDVFVEFLWLARVRASHYHIRKIWMFDRMFEQFDSPRAQALARQRKRARGLHSCTCLQNPTNTSRNIAF